MKDEILRLLLWEDFEHRSQAQSARKWPQSRTREPQREEKSGEDVVTALTAILTPPKPKKTPADVLRDLLSPAVAAQPATMVPPSPRVFLSCDYCGRAGHGRDRCFQIHPDMRPK